MMEGKSSTLSRDALEEAAEVLTCLSPSTSPEWHACPVQQCARQAECSSHLKLHLLADHFALVNSFAETLRRLTKVQHCPWESDCSKLTPGEDLQKHIATCHLLDAWAIAQKLHRSYNYSSLPSLGSSARSARQAGACAVISPSLPYKQCPAAARNGAQQELQGIQADWAGRSGRRGVGSVPLARPLLHPCPLGCAAKPMQPWQVAPHVLDQHLDMLVGWSVLQRKRLAASVQCTVYQTSHAHCKPSWSELATAAQPQATMNSPNDEHSGAQQTPTSMQGQAFHQAEEARTSSPSGLTPTCTAWIHPASPNHVNAPIVPTLATCSPASHADSGTWVWMQNTTQQPAAVSQVPLARNVKQYQEPVLVDAVGHHTRQVWAQPASSSKSVQRSSMQLGWPAGVACLVEEVSRMACELADLRGGLVSMSTRAASTVQAEGLAKFIQALLPKLHALAARCGDLAACYSATQASTQAVGTGWDAATPPWSQQIHSMAASLKDLAAGHCLLLCSGLPASGASTRAIQTASGLPVIGHGNDGVCETAAAAKDKHVPCGLHQAAASLQQQLGSLLQQLMLLLDAAAASPVKQPHLHDNVHVNCAHGKGVTPTSTEEGACSKRADCQDVIRLGTWNLEGLEYMGSSSHTTPWLHSAASAMVRNRLQLCWLQHLPCQAAASAVQVLLQDSDPQGDWCCQYVEVPVQPGAARGRQQHALIWRRGASESAVDSLRLWRGQTEAAVHLLEETHGLFSCVPLYALLCVRQHLLLTISVSLPHDPAQAVAELQRLPLLVLAAQLANEQLLQASARLTVMIMGALDVHASCSNSMPSQRSAVKAALDQLALMGWVKAVPTSEGANIGTNTTAAWGCNILLQKGILPPGCQARHLPIHMTTFSAESVKTNGLHTASGAAASDRTQPGLPQHHHMAALEWWAPPPVAWTLPLGATQATAETILPDTSLPFCLPDLQQACWEVMKQAGRPAGAAGPACYLLHDEQVQRVAAVAAAAVDIHAKLPPHDARPASKYGDHQLLLSVQASADKHEGTNFPLSPRIPTNRAAGSSVLGHTREDVPNELSLSWEDQVLRSMQKSPAADHTGLITGPTTLSPPSPTHHLPARAASPTPNLHPTTRPIPANSVTAAVRLLWDAPADAVATNDVAADKKVDQHVMSHNSGPPLTVQPSSMEQGVLTVTNGQGMTKQAGLLNTESGSGSALQYGFLRTEQSGIMPDVGGSKALRDEQHHGKRPSAIVDGAAVDINKLQKSGGLPQPQPLPQQQDLQQQQEQKVTSHQKPDFLPQAEVLLQNNPDEWMLTIQGSNTAAEEMVAAAQAVAALHGISAGNTVAAPAAADQSRQALEVRSALQATGPTLIPTPAPRPAYQIPEFTNVQAQQPSTAHSMLPAAQHTSDSRGMASAMQLQASSTPQAGIESPSPCSTPQASSASHALAPHVAGALTASVSGSSSGGISEDEQDEDAWVISNLSGHGAQMMQTEARHGAQEQAQAAVDAEPTTVLLPLDGTSTGGGQAVIAGPQANSLQPDQEPDSRVQQAVGVPAVRLWRPEQPASAATDSTLSYGQVSAADAMTGQTGLWRPQASISPRNLGSNVVGSMEAGVDSEESSADSECSQLQGDGAPDADVGTELGASCQGTAQLNTPAASTSVHANRGDSTPLHYSGGTSQQQQQQREAGGFSSESTAPQAGPVHTSRDADADLVADFLAAEGISSRSTGPDTQPVQYRSGTPATSQVDGDAGTSSTVSEDFSQGDDQMVLELLGEPVSLRGQQSQPAQQQQQAKPERQAQPRLLAGPGIEASWGRDTVAAQPAEQQQQQPPSGQEQVQQAQLQQQEKQQQQLEGQKQPQKPKPQQEVDILQLLGDSSEEDCSDEDDISKNSDRQSNSRQPRTYLEVLASPAAKLASSAKTLQQAASHASFKQQQQQQAAPATSHTALSHQVQQLQQQVSQSVDTRAAPLSLSDSSWADMLVDPDEFMKSLSKPAAHKVEPTSQPSKAAAAVGSPAAGHMPGSRTTGHHMQATAAPTQGWQSKSMQHTTHSGFNASKPQLDDLQLFSDGEDDLFSAANKKPLQQPPQPRSQSWAAPPWASKSAGFSSDARPAVVATAARSIQPAPAARPAAGADADLHLVDALLEEMEL